MSSSPRELHVWPPWLSPLSRPSPRLSFHILASAAPQLLRWLQVRVFGALPTEKITLLQSALFYFLHGSVLFSLFSSEIVKFSKFGNSLSCKAPHGLLLKQKQTSWGAVHFSNNYCVCSQWMDNFIFVSNFRDVSVCWIFSSPLPKNYTAHLTCSSSAQPHPKPCQLHGAHHRI